MLLDEIWLDVACTARVMYGQNFSFGDLAVLLASRFIVNQIVTTGKLDRSSFAHGAAVRKVSLTCVGRYADVLTVDTSVRGEEDECSMNVCNRCK